MSSPPKLRTTFDRLRQVFLFEVGGLLLITPPFIWLSGVPLHDSLGLMVAMAIIAGVWNTLYNIGFDWADARLSGRSADQRPTAWRIVHALGFEGGLLLISLPMVMMWTGMDWLQALIADIGLAAAYVVYAYGFNLGYDRFFPVAQTD